jgi:hypothetical protein
VLEGLETEAREARKGLWTDPQPVPALTVERLSLRCDQDVQVLAGRQRQCVGFCAGGPLGRCWGADAFWSVFVERKISDFMAASFLGLPPHGQPALRSRHRERDEWMIESGQASAGHRSIRHSAGRFDQAKPTPGGAGHGLLPDGRRREPAIRLMAAFRSSGRTAARSPGPSRNMLDSRCA